MQRQCQKNGYLSLALLAKGGSQPEFGLVWMDGWGFTCTLLGLRQYYGMRMGFLLCCFGVCLLVPRPGREAGKLAGWVGCVVLWCADRVSWMDRRPALAMGSHPGKKT